MSGESDLVAHCVHFCRVLRERGMPVTIGEVLLAARSLELVDLSDPDELRMALRTVLAVSREQFPLFDLTFDEIWRGVAPSAPRAGSGGQTTRRPGAPGMTPVTLDRWMRAPAPEPEGGEATRVPVRAASDRESIGRRDFSSFGNADAEAFERVARRIARRLSLRPSRRWKPATRGPRVDMRRTIRGSLRTGGDAVTLERRARKVRRTRLVAMCDVSGSMEPYARFLLQFLHAMQNTFARVETFVFSTRLTRTTDLLRRARWEVALSGVARDVTDWSGGTRIGESLSRFVAEWLSLVDTRTVVLVLSDGWETGDPEVLGTAMDAIHRRAGKVIWLNPLLASPDYAPETRGMVAALPYIDVLAPGHNLESLDKLVSELTI